MDAHSAIHVPLYNYNQGLESGLGGRFGFLLFFFFFFLINRGPCLCSAVFCGEHGFFKGGGSEMKEGVNEW